jgi:hypothetical protein
MENVDKYLGWIREGKSFSEIREDLGRQGLPAEEINRLILEIDEAALQQASTGSAMAHLDWTRIGLVIMGVGALCYLLLLKVFHYAGSLTITVIFLAAGGAMIFLGYKAKNNKTGRRGKRKFDIRGR